MLCGAEIEALGPSGALDAATCTGRPLCADGGWQWYQHDAVHLRTRPLTGGLDLDVVLLQVGVDAAGPCGAGRVDGLARRLPRLGHLPTITRGRRPAIVLMPIFLTRVIRDARNDAQLLCLRAQPFMEMVRAVCNRPQASPITRLRRGKLLISPPPHPKALGGGDTTPRRTVTFGAGTGTPFRMC